MLKPPRPSKLDESTLRAFSSSSGVVSTSLGSWCVLMNSATFSLWSFKSLPKSGTTKSASRRPGGPHLTKIFRKAAFAKHDIKANVIDGIETRATTVAITVDLLLKFEDSVGGGGGSAIRSDNCEISTDTPRKPKCSSFETNPPFEVVFNESRIVDAEKSSDASITKSTKSGSASASNFLRLPLESIATTITAGTETSVISATTSSSVGNLGAEVLPRMYCWRFVR